MGKVIGIFSAKGGVGKSILATNLGVAFAANDPGQTAIIDLHPGLGCVDLLLDLQPERTWSDLLPVINELTLKHLALSVARCHDGLDVLAAPKSFRWSNSLSAEHVIALLEGLRRAYTLVVVDTPAGGGGSNREAYYTSDLRLVVLTPDAPALRSTGRFLHSVAGKVQETGLVINQFSPGAAAHPDEIQDHLGIPVYGVLPMDPKSVWSNVSYGEPCVLIKRSALGTSIQRLSAEIRRQMGIDQR